MRKSKVRKKAHRTPTSVRLNESSRQALSLLKTIFPRFTVTEVIQNAIHAYAAQCRGANLIEDKP